MAQTEALKPAQVRTRFSTFVITIFALAIVVAGGYVFFSHPGDPETNIRPLSTSAPQQ